MMTTFLPKTIRETIEELSKLPGIGPKSAQRLVMHLLYSPESRANQLAEAIRNLKQGLQFCQWCWNVSEKELCNICADVNRNQQQICVVEEILDVMALEKTGEFHGTYHVLHGVLSPVDNIGPEQLKIQELIERVKNIATSGKTIVDKHLDARLPKLSPAMRSKGQIEVIIATNPSLEGEATALFLGRALKPLGAHVTRIARGLPAGGDLDYADEVTLACALEGRREIHGISSDSP